MSHVFISYVRENADLADKLCNDLKQHGVDIWLDRNNIDGGSYWKDSIRNAIKEGAFFIACFSEEYYQKEKSFMNEELSLAIDELRQYSMKKIWFIPVLFSECDIPIRSIGGGYTIADIQFIPLYENWDEGINRIVTVINPKERIELENKIHALANSYREYNYHIGVVAEDYSPDDEIEEELEEWELRDEAEIEYIKCAKLYQKKYKIKLDPLEKLKKNKGVAH